MINIQLHPRAFAATYQPSNVDQAFRDAMTVAGLDGEASVQFFLKWGLTDQRQILQVAAAALQQSPRAVRYLGKCGIKDQKTFVRLVLETVRQDPDQALAVCKKLGLNQEVVLQVAEIFAAARFIEFKDDARWASVLPDGWHEQLVASHTSETSS